MDNFRNKKGDQKYYNGVELDDDGLELMEAAMNIALEQIKIKNKKKYTPNKYKKQDGGIFEQRVYKKRG